MANTLSRRKSTPPQAAAPPRAATPGDNERAAEEADRVQFLSFLTRLNDADAGIEEARAPLKAAQNARKTVIGMAKAAGFPEWELRRRQEEAKRTTAENAEYEARERRQRRWAGIITPEQAKMHLEGDTPEEVRDAAHYKAEGYKAGLRNEAAAPPEGTPARFLQEWMQGHSSGHKDYLLGQAGMSPRPPGSDVQQIADDAAAKLSADTEAGDDAGDDPPGDPDDAFEASPDELQDQSTRQAVQDAHDGRTSGEVL